MTLLDVRDLTVTYKTGTGVVTALDSLTFSMKENEIVALVGESGCGKSTLGLAVIQLLPKRISVIAGGTILFKDTDFTKLTEKEMRFHRGSGVFMIFQEPVTALNPVFTVERQIGECIRVRERRMFSEKRAISNTREEIIDVLRRVRIPDPESVLRRYPHELSGGMRQRVMIGMALAAKPSLLIADEPTSAVDVTIQAEIIRLMRDLMKEVNTAILFITHDLGVAAGLAERVAVMYAGDIVETADAEQLFRNPLHPYTQGLLRSLPAGYDDEPELQAIEGSVPTLGQLPTGCRFHPRCPYAKKECRTSKPMNYEPQTDHRVACILYG
jgi:peptide/nickel transport system ATP-binding protein